MKVTAAVTAHREGHLAVASMRSLIDTVDAARQSGIEVQEIYALDRPDDATRTVIESFARHRSALLLEVEYGDQGKTRNDVVSKADGDYIAFLDADDLWQPEWVVRAAAAAAEADDPTIIWHPEFNYFFEESASIFCHLPQTDTSFTFDALRIVNFWDALAFTPRAWHEEVPFPDRDMESGFAYEDWFWNAEVILRGAEHRVVHDTVIFKRRQQLSQTVRASQRKALPPWSAFWRFNGLES